MARSNIPKFGNWENEENVFYTGYFEQARKNRGGKMINPNDPQQNPHLFSSPSQPPPPPPKPNENKLGEHGNFGQSRNDHAAGTGRGLGQQARSPQRAAGNRYADHGIAARPQPRPNRVDQNYNKGAALPKFGQWNESDLQSAENYTHVFNRAREERKAAGMPGDVASPQKPAASPPPPSFGAANKRNTKKGCFPWW